MNQPIRTPAKELNSDRLVLRARELNQVTEVFQLVEKNRSHLAEWMPWVEHSKSEYDTKEYIEQTISWWQDGSQFDFSIFEKTTNRIIGSIAAYNIDWSNKKCFIGFWIDSDYQGKSYISEALNCLEKILLDLGLHRMSITCDRRNSRSQNVAIRNHYKFESLAIDDCLERGRLRDTLKFTKLFNPHIEGSITLNLPEGYAIREVDEKTFWPMVKIPMKQIFNDNQMILDVASILTAEERAKAQELRSHFNFACKTFFCVYYGEQLAGWSWGYQDSPDSFFMVNSAILPQYRGRNLYSRLLETMLAKVVPLGFQKIWSFHSLTNNPIIIAKLKRNFYITSIEISDAYGTLVRLTHYTNKDRARALEFRVGEILPDDKLKKMFNLN